MVRSTSLAYASQVRVAAVTAELMADRVQDEQHDTDVIEELFARIFLIALVPLFAVGRAVLDPAWAARAATSVVGIVSGVVVVLLTVAGAWWVWRVTTPPYTLRRPAHPEGPSRSDYRSGAEQLAVRLAAGQGLGAGAISASDAVEAAIRLSTGGAGEGRAASVTLIPFLACLLPALLIIVLG